jgi:mRNA-degrading endonuclease RelE of RelBE toxin-antitoxin system
MAEVILRPGAAEELEEMPKVIHGRVLKLLERLKEWPQVSGVKALTGELAGNFRLRTGDYRLQFRLDGERVIVEKIGHRDGFYED